MRETEWFEGKRLEKLHERCFWRRVGFGAWAIFLIFLLLMLASCATTKEVKEDEPRICFMKGIGRTPDGMHVVAQQCMSQEAFQEMQK